MKRIRQTIDKMIDEARTLNRKHTHLHIAALLAPGHATIVAPNLTTGGCHAETEVYKKWRWEKQKPRV